MNWDLYKCVNKLWKKYSLQFQKERHYVGLFLCVIVINTAYLQIGKHYWKGMLGPHFELYMNILYVLLIINNHTVNKLNFFGWESEHGFSYTFHIIFNEFHLVNHTERNVLLYINSAFGVWRSYTVQISPLKLNPAHYRAIVWLSYCCDKHE